MQETNDTVNNEIDFTYYLEVIFKRFWIIVAFVLLGVLAAALVNNFMRPAYKATAVLMINQEDAGKINIYENLGKKIADGRSISDFNVQEL